MMVFNLNKFKKLLLSIAIPLIAGFIGYLLSGGNTTYYFINKPSFSPPAILFPIVWTILYILMGISYYIISTKNNNETALKVYYLQLIVNGLWSFLFFRLNLFLISALWIILLIVLVVYMIITFFKINKTAGLLQLPYLAWLIFACILNFSIYFLN